MSDGIFENVSAHHSAAIGRQGVLHELFAHSAAISGADAAVMQERVYKPGNKAPITASFRVFNPDGSFAEAYRKVEAGKRFPPLLRRGQYFRYGRPIWLQ